MYELFLYMDTLTLVVGACLGAFIATLLYILASWVDYRWSLKDAKRRCYDAMEWSEILFQGSYWDRRVALEIVLPEVA